jgi:hypothetical protein
MTQGNWAACQGHRKVEAPLAPDTLVATGRPSSALAAG